jgi:hypothetical protein
MRVPVSVKLALGSAALTALLAGCSGGGSQMTPTTTVALDGGSQQQPSLVRQPTDPMRGLGASVSGLLPLVHELPGPSWIDSTVKPEIYVANLSTNSVDIFSGTGVPGGSITGLNGPSGLAVDAKGNLYVANENAQDLLVFAPGTTTPKLTLTDTGNFPSGVTVDAAGNVYVANICAGPAGGTSCTGDGSIYKYKAGSSTKSVSYKNTSILRPYFVAFDEKPNVLWADGLTTQQSSGTPVVGFWTKSTTFTNSGISIGYPGGMETDKSDNLAVDDQLGPSATCCQSTVYVFAKGKPPATHSLRLAADACDVVSFSLNMKNTDVWSACDIIPPFNPGTPGRSDELPYPAGGAVLKTIDAAHLVSAVALAPASSN